MSLAPSISSERRARVAHLAPAFGIYVHIPFCAARCPYCDFNTYVGIDDLAPRYLDALVEEAAMWAETLDPPEAGSVFFGGGTPTLVDPRLLARALGRLRGIMPVACGAEVTVEANPESVSAERLAVLRDAGVNRVSVGAQSFRPHVLAALGRLHSIDGTRRAVAAARAAGFGNLNLDLIYGTPGESVDDWRASLEDAVALGPEHVSCYALGIEPGTAFGADVAAGRMPAPSDDDQAEKYELALDLLAEAGFEHYEISNWALPGRASRHNLVYWTLGDYAGLGAGAHSHRRGERWWNVKLPRAYAARPGAARDGQERLDPHVRAEEWLMLRLRLVEGVERTELEERLHHRVSWESLAAAGLAEPASDRLVLTRRGLLLHNDVAVTLLALPGSEC